MVVIVSTTMCCLRTEILVDLLLCSCLLFRVIMKYRSGYIMEEIMLAIMCGWLHLLFLFVASGFRSSSFLVSVIAVGLVNTAAVVYTSSQGICSYATIITATIMCILEMCVLG